MKKSQIAAQLYTLREHLKTPADIARSLKRVKAIGFDAVQLSGMGPIDEAELNKMLAGEGLICCATHEKGVTIVEDVQRVIDRLGKLHCQYTAYPFPHALPTSYAETVALAKQLNTAAEVMAKAGMTLCYHNHAHEFERFDGEIMLDIIYNHAPALQAELDTFWVQAGGCDPVDWVKKFAGRQPLLHLKDFGIVKSERAMRPIGQGNLNWTRIIPAAEAARVKYFIIEQDVCQKCPFESLEDSLRYLTEHFVD
jgi:sugar phosphate isomerase/epimerase